MLELNHVCFSYDDREILRDINLKVEAGEFVAVVGHNGAGKSTLLKLFNGLLKPTSGEVLVEGRDTRQTKTSKLARSIGYLFQNPDRQICQKTVYDEVAFNLVCAGLPEPEIRQRCQETLEQFGFRGEAEPFSLSRGERQRLMLAALIAARPKILVLDEPTTGLDYRECIHMMELIQSLNRQGTTVIMVSHDMEVVADYARRAVVLGGGRILAEGEFRRVIRSKEALEEAGLLPPQVIQLALRLGGRYENASTVEEMTEILREGKL